MKWHDYPTSYRGFFRRFEKMYGIRERENHVHTAHEVASIYASHAKDGPSKQNCVVQLLTEGHWLADRRPYYNMWPSVIRPFTKIDLNKVRVTDVKLPLDRLVIRLPVGHELYGAHSIFVAKGHGAEDNAPALLTCINSGIVAEDISISTITAFTMNEGESVLDRLKFGRDNPYCDEDKKEEMVDACLRLVVAICLLNNNPDLIEQSPLESDRAKWEATHDIKLIQKAERRGKLEWDIGRHIEVAPGWRNAHFAIRWMGQKVVEKTPVLRPIKGCMVRRKEIEEVPTGYLDEDEDAPLC